MTSSVKPPNQRVSLDVLGQWHSIARGATAEQIAIAFRGRRNVEQRHLLRHNFHVHLTNLADPSAATMRAGVESARLELPESIGAQILEWTKTRDGLRTIGALTVAMDVLYRLLDDMTDELPSQQTWEKIGPAFMRALRHLCSVKIEEINRDHDVRPPLQTMMVHVFTRAQRYVLVPTHWRVTHREILAAMIKPAGLFIEMGRMRRMGAESPERLEPFDDAPDLDELIARRDRDSADMLTRPMGHPVLREDMSDDDVWDLGGEHDLVDD